MTLDGRFSDWDRNDATQGVRVPSVSRDSMDMGYDNYPRSCPGVWIVRSSILVSHNMVYAVSREDRTQKKLLLLLLWHLKRISVIMEEFLDIFEPERSSDQICECHHRDQMFAAGFFIDRHWRSPLLWSRFFWNIGTSWGTAGNYEWEWIWLKLALEMSWDYSLHEYPWELFKISRKTTVRKQRSLITCSTQVYIRHDLVDTSHYCI